MIDPGGSGTGGDGSGASGASGPGPTTGPSNVTTGPNPGVCVDDTFGESRAMAGDCAAACEILFCCAERECPAVEPGFDEVFIDGCQQTCVEQMALIAVVDGTDCEGTISTVTSVSQEFADTCFDGP